jgi:hypothetical protein
VQSVYALVRNNNKDEVLSSFLKNGNDNVIVSAVKAPDFKDRQKPLQIGFNLTTHHQVTKARNEIYVALDWSKEFSDLEMPEDRKNDYEFPQKYYLATHTELALPAGYKPTYLPAAFKKSTPDYSFEGSYTNTGKSVVYKKTIVVNKAILRRTEFAQWNAFVADINKFYNDQVVLAQGDVAEVAQEPAEKKPSAAGAKQPVKAAQPKPPVKRTR